MLMLSIGVATLGVIPNVNAEEIGQEICELTAVDDKKGLRSLLRNNKLKVRGVYKGIECNGMSLVQFAASTGSLEVGEYFIAKVPRNKIKRDMELVKPLSPELYEKILERIR